MLFNLLRILLIIDAFVLVGVVLLQSGKGSGLAANFGGASSSPDAFIGIRQAGNILTKASWWCGGIFLGLALVLQIMSTQQRAPRSVLEKTLTPPATTAPSPVTTAPGLPLEPQTTNASTPATGTATPAPAKIPPAGTAPAKR